LAEIIETSWTTRARACPQVLTVDDRQSSNDTINHNNLSVIVSTASHRHCGHRMTRMRMINVPADINNDSRFGSPLRFAARLVHLLASRCDSNCQSSAGYATLVLRRSVPECFSFFLFFLIARGYRSRDIAQSKSHIASQNRQDTEEKRDKGTLLLVQETWQRRRSSTPPWTWSGVCRKTVRWSHTHVTHHRAVIAALSQRVCGAP